MQDGRRDDVVGVVRALEQRGDLERVRDEGGSVGLALLAGCRSCAKAAAERQR